MLDLNDIFYFMQMVDRGGFAAPGGTLHIPKSTLSHRIQRLETNLGVRLLNRTSRRLGMTNAGEELYRHSVATLREAGEAETAIRHRLPEPRGTARRTVGVATMQFAMRDIVTTSRVRYPEVNVVAHATDQTIDIVGQNYDVAIRTDSDPLPDLTLVQRTLAPAPWFLFAGSAYFNATDTPQTPQDLEKHPLLFMMTNRSCSCLAAAPFERREGQGGHAADTKALERRHDRREAGGVCKHGDRRAAGLRVS